MLDDREPPRVADVLSIPDAAKFLAARVPPERHDGPRSAKDRAEKRIKRAIKGGRLLAAENRIAFGELIRWAISIPEWAEHLQGLPLNQAVHLVGFEMNASLGDIYRADAISGDLERCQASLVEAHDTIARLTAEVEGLKGRIAKMEPVILRRQEFQKAASVSGKKARGIPKKKRDC